MGEAFSSGKASNRQETTVPTEASCPTSTMGEAFSSGNCGKEPTNRQDITTVPAEESYLDRQKQVDDKITLLNSEVKTVKEMAIHIRSILMEDEGEPDRLPTPQQSDEASFQQIDLSRDPPLSDEERLCRLTSDLEQLKAMLFDVSHLTGHELSEDQINKGRVMTSDLRPHVTAKSVHISTTQVQSDDTISILEAQVKELHKLLVENIDKVLERGNRLDELAGATTRLV